VALATDTEARVVLVDLDLQFGDVSVLLSIENHLTSIDDLSQQGEQVEPEFLDEVLATGPEGMRVLLAPSSPEFADLVTTGNLRSILRELTRAYDYIVIDSPAHLDERTLEAVELADQIILVTGYNVTSVKNTKITMRLLEAMGVEHERMVVVLNQTRPKVSFTAEEIEKSLRSRVLASLPYEPRVDEAIDTGRPVLTIDPRSELARQIYRIVDYLTATPGEAAEAAGGQDRERRANRRRFSLGRR